MTNFVKLKYVGLDVPGDNYQPQMFYDELRLSASEL